MIVDEITVKISKFKLSPAQNVNYLGRLNNFGKKLAQTNGILSKLCQYVPQKACILGFFFPHLYNTAP